MTKDALETEFVCIPPPLERSATPDGGPMRYRVTHRANLWKPGEHPTLVQKVIEATRGTLSDRRRAHSLGPARATA